LKNTNLQTKYTPEISYSKQEDRFILFHCLLDLLIKLVIRVGNMYSS